MHIPKLIFNFTTAGFILFVASNWAENGKLPTESGLGTAFGCLRTQVPDNARINGGVR